MNRKHFFISMLWVINFLFIAHLSGDNYTLGAFRRVELEKSPLNGSDSSNLPIGVFYDGDYSEPWNFNALELTNYLNQSLSGYNLSFSILNGTALREFMEANPIGIIIITMGVAPSTIWNGSDNSFVEMWLDNGGIIIWTGCQEFYWIGYNSGDNIPIGEVGAQYVLDMDYIVTISNQQVLPTALGNDLFLNLSAHKSDIFSSISVLSEEKVYHEVYAKYGDWADPVLFQPKGGRGYFIRIHANWNDNLAISELADWISSYIYNRFIKLPIISSLYLIESLYLFTSKEICINLSSFSDSYGLLLINGTSDGFSDINTSVIIAPKEQLRLNFSLIPLSLARFQEYEFQLDVYSNFTDDQNNSKNLLVYSKRISISVQTPIEIEAITTPEGMYPGGSYFISLNITNYINQSIPVDVVLICDGCVNQIKSQFTLDEINNQIQIIFSIRLTTKSDSYQLYIRIYQEEVILASSEVSVDIGSIFKNPLIIFGLIITFSLFISLLGVYIYQRKRKKEQLQFPANKRADLERKSNNGSKR